MKTRIAAGLLGVAVVLGGCARGRTPAGSDPGGSMRVVRGSIDGLAGPAFSLVAREGFISTADGNSLYAWGYAAGTGGMQYPGPTLFVNQGERVTVELGNELSVPVSMVFPGQVDVVTSGGAAGLLTAEAPPGGSVTYEFTATRPGTFQYHSGTDPAVQVGLGLMGVLIVRPTGYDPATQRLAYDHPGTGYDREYLFLLSEMDPRLNDLAMQGRLAEADALDYQPQYWFINGRTGPDTMGPELAPWLPTQPYGGMALMHPGERLLMRVVGAGRDLHPFHHHGNNARTLARDAQLLQSAPGAGPDLAVSDYTLKVVPGETYDAIFQWTGKGLGWDLYGHAAADPLQPSEHPEDHGKPFPVALPGLQEVTVGEGYSGSPFLGAQGSLPADVVSSATGGFFYMWHSHTERELTNFDIFPGGLMTMLIIQHPSVPISD